MVMPNIVVAYLLEAGGKGANAAGFSSTGVQNAHQQAAL